MPSKLCEVTSLEQVTLSQGFVRSSKENVSIKTKLVSTKLTQNVDLMKLLNWKSNQQHIEDTLTKIMNLSGTVEIVKFLQDILDALFAMFSTEDGNSNKYSGIISQFANFFCIFLEMFHELNVTFFGNVQIILDFILKNLIPN